MNTQKYEIAVAKLQEMQPKFGDEDWLLALKLIKEIGKKKNEYKQSTVINLVKKIESKKDDT